MSVFLRSSQEHQELIYDPTIINTEGQNFGFNQFLLETNKKILYNNQKLILLSQRNTDIINEYRLDSIELPTEENTPAGDLTPQFIDKYHKMTFRQKEELLHKLGEAVTARSSVAAAAAAAAADADADAAATAQTNLLLKMLFLHQTPFLNGPGFTGPRDAETLVKLSRKMDIIEKKAAAEPSYLSFDAAVVVRDLVIFALSATSALVVGYVAASVATSFAAAAAATTAATAATATTAATAAAVPAVSMFSATPLNLMVKVFTVVHSARKGQTIQESLQIMLKTGSREALTFSTSLVVGEGSRRAATFVTKMAATDPSSVNMLLGYLVSPRMFMYMANDGMRLVMQNIKFIQPTAGELAWDAEQKRKEALFKDQQDFIDLCNEVQNGYKRPLKIMEEAYATFKIKLDQKTKNHPYIATFLILMAGSVVANNMFDVAMGKAGALATKLPFGVGATFSEYINVGLVANSIKELYVYPSVFQTINEILPIKKNIMAKLTRLINLSADEFITLDKIVERKLTVAMLLKNIMYYFTNVAVTVMQEDLIRKGVSYDYVGNAGKLYKNLKTDISASLDKNIFGAITNVTDRMYELFSVASDVFNANVPKNVDEQSMLLWFQSCLTKISTIFATTATAATSTQAEMNAQAQAAQAAAAQAQAAQAAAAQAQAEAAQAQAEAAQAQAQAEAAQAQAAQAQEEEEAQALAAQAQAQAQALAAQAQAAQAAAKAQEEAQAAAKAQEEAQAAAKAQAAAQAEKESNDEKRNSIMDASKKMQKRFDDLRLESRAMQEHMAQIKDVKTGLQTAMSGGSGGSGGNKALTSADLNKLVEDMSQLQSINDNLGNLSGLVDRAINIFDASVGAKIGYGLFTANAPNLDRTTKDLKEYGKQLESIEAAVALAKANTAKEVAEIKAVAQTQIQNAQIQFETYGNLLATSDELNRLIGGGSEGTSLMVQQRETYEGVGRMNEQISQLRAMIKSVKTHQENLNRLAEDKSQLTKIQGEGKTDVFCDGKKTTCAQVAANDLKTLEAYINDPAVSSFEQSIRDAANALLSSPSITSITAPVPAPPPYPFEMNPALKRYTLVWGQLMGLTTEVGYQALLEQLRKHNLTLSQLASGFIGNGQPIEPQINQLREIMAAAHASAQSDKTEMNAVINHANEVYVAASQAKNILGSSSSSSSAKRNMRQNLLDANDLLSNALGARNKLRDIDTHIGDMLKGMATGKNTPGGVTAADVEAASAVLKNVQKAQGVLDDKLVSGYTDILFGAPKSTASKQANTTPTTPISQNSAATTVIPRIPSLADIFAFSQQRTAVMYNTVVKHKMDLKIGTEMTPELRRDIDSMFNDIINNSLPKPGDEKYDERFNDMIRDVLSTPGSLESDSLMSMYHNLNEEIRRHVGDAALTLSGVGAIPNALAKLYSSVPDIDITTGAATLGVLEKPLKVIDFFGKYANDAESPSLAFMRAQMLKMERLRLTTEASYDFVLTEAGFGPKESPLLQMTSSQVNYAEFIGNLLVTGGGAGALKRMFFDPFKTNTDSAAASASASTFGQNIPVLGQVFAAVGTASTVAGTLNDVAEAISIEGLRDESVLNVLFGKDFDYAKAAANWKTAASESKHFLSWALRSSSITNSIINTLGFGASKDTKEMDILQSWYGSNRVNVLKACQDQSITAVLKFLCPSSMKH